MDYIEIRPLTSKWFTEATPANYAEATATIGTGEHKAITVICDDEIECATKIEIVVAETANAALAAALSSGTITITLGTDADSAAVAAKNTAKLIAAKISTISGYTATEAGTGATAYTADDVTTEDITFTNGSYATPCSDTGVCLVSSGTYYVCIEGSNSPYHTNWRSFTLTTI